MRRCSGSVEPVIRTRVALGLGKRWHAACEIDSLERPWYWFTPRALVAGLATLDYRRPC
jgi:hypothetical protein